MKIYKIPLQNYPQKFSIQIEGGVYSLTTRWNEYSKCWFIDIYNDKTGKPEILSIPLLAGVDILGQYRHVGLLNGILFTVTDGDIYADPKLENLGGAANLYYTDERLAT